MPELGAVTALDLVTAYLKYVRQMLLEHSNLELCQGEPLQAMIAVPAHASTRQRFTTLEAFKRAGFEVTGLLGEPTAAAVEFAHRNRNVLSARSPKRYVVVYDLGGGTFDTAAVSLVDRRFDLLAAEGIASLGGADFDAMILELATQQPGIDASTLSPSASVRLLEHCREAKEGLRPGSRRLLIDLSEAGLGSESIVLDTAELYAHCQPLIERTVQMVDRLFTDLAGRGVDIENARQLGGLYLVGGSSAFPAVARTLRETYTHAPDGTIAVAIENITRGYRREYVLGAL